MRVFKATHLALALLVVAGPGVAASSAAAQTSGQKKATSVRTRSSSHRGKLRRRSSWRRGQMTPTAQRISEIQEALAKDGSFDGKPNGKWDNATVEGLKRFQETHGLSPTGKLDARTLQQLGLGSQTAGVAPPIPAVGSTLAGSAGQATRHPQ